MTAINLLEHISYGLNAAQSQAGAIELTNLFVDVRGGAPSLRKRPGFLPIGDVFNPESYSPVSGDYVPYIHSWDSESRLICCVKGRIFSTSLVDTFGQPLFYWNDITPIEGADRFNYNANIIFASDPNGVYMTDGYKILWLGKNSSNAVNLRTFSYAKPETVSSPPSEIQDMCFFKGYILAIEKDTRNIFFAIRNPTDSTIYEPMPFNPIPLTFTGGDNAVALAAGWDELTIFYERSSEVHYSSADLNNRFPILAGASSEKGAVNNRTVKKLGNSIYWLTPDKKVVRVSERQIQDVSMPINAELSKLNRQGLIDSYASTMSDRMYLLEIPALETTFVLDTLTGAWYKWNSVLTKGSLKITSVANLEGIEILASATNIIMYSDINYGADNGLPVEIKAVTAYNDEGTFNRKFARALKLRVQGSEETTGVQKTFVPMLLENVSQETFSTSPSLEDDTYSWTAFQKFHGDIPFKSVEHNGKIYSISSKNVYISDSINRFDIKRINKSEFSEDFLTAGVVVNVNRLTGITLTDYGVFICSLKHIYKIINDELVEFSPSYVPSGVIDNYFGMAYFDNTVVIITKGGSVAVYISSFNGLYKGHEQASKNVSDTDKYAQGNATYYNTVSPDIIVIKHPHEIHVPQTERNLWSIYWAVLPAVGAKAIIYHHQYRENFPIAVKDYMETLTPTELRVGFQYGLEIGRTIRLAHNPQTNRVYLLDKVVLGGDIELNIIYFNGLLPEPTNIDFVVETITIPEVIGHNTTVIWNPQLVMGQQSKLFVYLPIIELLKDYDITQPFPMFTYSKARTMVYEIDTYAVRPITLRTILPEFVYWVDNVYNRKGLLYTVAPTSIAYGGAMRDPDTLGYDGDFYVIFQGVLKVNRFEIRPVFVDSNNVLMIYWKSDGKNISHTREIDLGYNNSAAIVKVIRGLGSYHTRQWIFKAANTHILSITGIDLEVQL